MNSPTAYVTRCYRGARILAHILYAVWLAAWFSRFSKARQALILKRWSLKLFDILNIRLAIRGDPPSVLPRNSMLVANHISWLDIYLLYTLYPARFIAKSELRSWPVIGWLCEKAGTLFIERAKRRDTARINQSISDALITGDCIAVFPEGTTTDGTYLYAFHSSLLEPAVLAQARVYPVGIRFATSGGAINTEAAYIDEMNMADSFRKILAQREIRAELIFAEPIAAHGKNRRELARAAETAIASRLNLAVRHRKPGKRDDFPDTQQSGSPPTGSPYPAPEDSREQARPALTSARK
jgi:1-acyl-sn-glycerol-3-phosphate acyltransferase